MNRLARPSIKIVNGQFTMNKRIRRALVVVIPMRHPGPAWNGRSRNGRSCRRDEDARAEGLLRDNDGDETFADTGGVSGSDGVCAFEADGDEMIFSHMLRS